MRNTAERTSLKEVQAKESPAHTVAGSAGWLFLNNSAADLAAEEWPVPLLSSSVDSDRNTEAWVKFLQNVPPETVAPAQQRTAGRQFGKRLPHPPPEE